MSARENYVLDPDSPILEQFQKALKEHLLAQIEKTKREVYEIETATNEKNAELEKIGEQSYEMQIQNKQQQKTLEETILSLNSHMKLNEKATNEYEAKTKELKDLEQKLFHTEKHNRELNHEIESVRLLIDKISHHETKMDNNLAVNKSVLQNLSKTNVKLQKDKKRQDYLIYRLCTEVWKLEDEKETTSQVLEIKQNELEDLESKIAYLETTMQALESEHSALSSSWQTVCTDIANRDQKLETLEKQENNLRTQHIQLQGQIRNILSEIKKEQGCNLNFTLMKEKAELDARSLNTELTDLLEKKRVIEKNIYDTNALIEEMERDISETKVKNYKQEHFTAFLSQSLSVQLIKKNSMKDEMVAILERNVAVDQKSKKYTAYWKDIQTKCKDLKIKLETAENKYKVNLTERHIQKSLNEELETYLKEGNQQIKELEKESLELSTYNKKLQCRYRMKIEEYRHLSLKVSNLITSEKDSKLNLAHAKLVDSEKTIEVIRVDIKSLQEKWLHEQKSLLVVSSERQGQLNKINNLRREALMLEQKNYQMHEDINNLEKREKDIDIQIYSLQKKLVRITENYCKQKGKKVDLNDTTTFAQNVYAKQLHDAEIELLRLESDIAELEEEKIVISKQLIETNREGLEWENLVIMARNARKDCGQSQNVEKKLAVCRLKGVYSKLQKQQSRLVKELTNCLFTREKIYLMAESAEAVTKSRKQCSPQIKINQSRKIADKKNRVKRVKSDLEALKKQKVEVFKKLNEIKKLDYSQKEIQAEQETVKKETIKKLQEVKLNRHLKYELLLLCQRKSVLCQQIVANRKPYTIFRNLLDLEWYFTTEKGTNHKLTNIIESLKNYFPERSLEFNMMLHSLGVIIYLINCSWSLSDQHIKSQDLQ